MSIDGTPSNGRARLSWRNVTMPANLVRQLPVPAVALEVLDEQASGQPTVDLELREPAASGPVEDIGGEVGARGS